MLQTPVNFEALANHALFLRQKAYSEIDPVKAQAIRKRARHFGSAAIVGGSENLLVPLLLSEIREDGSVVEAVHSSDGKVHQLIAEGEQKFSRGDMDGALHAYQEALKLDPNSYRAALFAGDVYFTQHDYAAALPWFERAIAIAPDEETAYRYRADALTRLRRHDEAGFDYVNAFISAPFAQIPTAALNSWIGARKLTLKRTDSSYLAGSISVDNGKIALNYDPSAGGALSLAYLIARANYATSQNIDGKNYRQTLAEEIAGLGLLLKMNAESKQNAAEMPELKANAAGLARLEEIERDGLLEAFVLLDRPSADLMKDYSDYRAQHRDHLVRYIRKYWLGLAQ